MKIPTFLYTNVLQQLLTSKLNNETSATNEIYFKNITSKYLPNVSSFLLFWNETMTTDITSDYEYDYEIIEILQLYKNSNYKTGNLNCKNLLRLINHYFYPNVEIIDEKYVKNIKCKLWDKESEINDFLNSYKYKCLKNYNFNLNDTISISKLYDTLYDEYKKQLVDKIFIISYDYFKKFIYLKLQNYMKSDNLIDHRWIET
jgi:hypothetical protein